MDKGKISILMSIYNCEDTLKECINSVINQTYKNWEFIICDDCSTDGSLGIVKEYASKDKERFKIIRNQNNLKLAASLNHCLEYATGEYCARMDGDDYISPYRFEKQVDYLRNHGDIQLVGAWMQVFNEDGLGRIIQYKDKPEKSDLRKGPCFAHASIMTYTSVYRSLGGYTVSKRTVRSQDYDLWFRFYSKGYCGANISEPLYFVREDVNSFQRRKMRLYLWAIVTRWKGFRLLKFPLRYYPLVLSPVISMFGNELRKLKYNISGILQKENI